MCAWKYPQEWFEDGDIIEPSDWRINQNEFLTEVNGSLDNDNLYKKMFNHLAFQENTFNKLYKNTGQTAYFNHVGEGGWMRSGVASNADESIRFLPYLDVDAEEDGLVIVDCSMRHSWVRQPVDTSASEPTPYATEYAYFRPDSAYIKIRNAYVQCIMYRITCNGLQICSTGPLGNEYQDLPVYLCGAVPVIAGKNRIQVECRSVWYSPVLDRMMEASTRDPTVEIGGYDTPLRKCVYVNGKLIAHHRKR